MGLDFYRKAVYLQQKYSANHIIRNALQTNGHLLNAEWGKFLKENDFLVGLSMDGPPELHDIYRKTKSGSGSHAKALAGLNTLLQFGVETNILTCVSSANVHAPLDVYRYFRDDLGISFIQFIPIVERINTTGNQQGKKLSVRSISGQDYGNFLIEIFDEWIRQDVGRTFIQLFETCIGVWAGQPASLCIFSETCGSCLALEHNGDLYSCDHYVQPDALLGNITQSKIRTMVSSPAQRTFGEAKKSILPKQCLRCDVRFICNGGCPKNRITAPKKEEYPINHLCDGYKAFFHHIDEPIQLIVSLMRMNHPAHEIMGIYKDKRK